MYVSTSVECTGHCRGQAPTVHQPMYPTITLSSGPCSRRTPSELDSTKKAGDSAEVIWQAVTLRLKKREGKSHVFTPPLTGDSKHERS